MTYLTGAATDLEDLLSKLSVFAITTHGSGLTWATIYTVANPQTTDGWFELNNTVSMSLSVSMKYTPSTTSDPVNMSIHQARTPNLITTAPGEHTNDSGNGFNTSSVGHTNAELLGERCVSQIGNGAFPSFHFFADDASTADYIHVVVETETGTFRHFGFGILTKFGDNWVGGEYVYGCFIDQNPAVSATDPSTQTLLSGLGETGARRRAGTVRIASGLNNQSPAIWGVSLPIASVSLLDDSDTVIRRQIHGTYRSGMEASGFGSPVGTTSSGVVPMYSIAAYYRDPTINGVQLLGHMPDVRAMNVGNFESGTEITVGTDTWIPFPLSIKSAASVAGRTFNSGIAYKKVT